MNLFYKIGFWTKKHSPELLVAGAITSAVGAVAASIVATRKLDATLAPYNEKIESIRKNLKDDNKIANGEVDVKESKKELTTTYAKAALKVGLLYLPSAVLLGSSVGCVLGSHKILKGRNLALVAAYKTLESGYNSYRERVKEKLGEEAEEKLYKNISKEKVTEKDPETGKEKTVTKDVPHNNPNEYFDVLYDEANRGWEPNALMNFDWLMAQQAFLNNKFQRQGFLFLSDVYECLGFTVDILGPKRAQASHVLGWIYDPKDPKKDNYISFGLTHPGTGVALPRVQKQIEANQPSFWLSMNVDGDILTGNKGQKIFTDHAKDGI